MDLLPANVSNASATNGNNLVAQAFQVALYVQPIHFFLSVTTNLLNILVLCSRTLRSSPCAHYFLAYAVFSIVYSCLLCPTQFLRHYSIVWVNDVFNCKVSNYVLYVLPFQANLMLNFASFDRYCSSIRSRTFHPVSAIRSARIAIVLGTFSCALFILPMMFIHAWNPLARTCLIVTALAARVYIFHQVIVYFVLSPLLLIVFGLLTISNIRRHTARLEPHMRRGRTRRTERQLARMLLLQVAAHLIFSLPYGVIYMINSFQPSTQTTTVVGVRLMLVMWQQCDYFVSFFLYVFSGSVYRQQFFRLLRSIRYRLVASPVNTGQQ